MKYLGSIILAVVAALIVVFAVNNLQGASLDPWPLADPIEVPVYLIVLVSLLIGFFLGAAVTWIAGLPRRRRAAKQRREGVKAQAELDKIRARPEAAGTAVAPVEPAASTPAIGQ